MLWAVFTVLASGAQTLRNATQRDLTGRLGALGAAHVRFLFGFPFGLALLGLAVAVTGETLPGQNARSLLWTFAGGMAQIAATALMLTAMTRKSFVVTTAYTKTEPVQVAIFGLVFLGDRLTPMLAVAILIATAGVMVLGWPKGGNQDHKAADNTAALLGIAAGGLFALSAIGFRGGIHALDSGGVWMRASLTLAVGLGLQTLVLTLYLLARDRKMLAGIVAAWRPSLAAGMLGAAASQFWFLAFALTTAARVRTLALIEVLFAYAISGRLFRERLSAREGVGMALVVAGVALSLNA